MGKIYGVHNELFARQTSVRFITKPPLEFRFVAISPRPACAVSFLSARKIREGSARIRSVKILVVYARRAPTFRKVSVGNLAEEPGEIGPRLRYSAPMFRLPESRNAGKAPLLLRA